MDDVWIGLTEVSKGEGCELDLSGAGAFVWWATQADSEESFVRKLKGALEHYKLVLLDATEIRKVGEPGEAPEELWEIVERARENESWTLFGTFHMYRHHNA